MWGGIAYLECRLFPLSLKWAQICNYFGDKGNHAVILLRYLDVSAHLFVPYKKSVKIYKPVCYIPTLFNKTYPNASRVQ